MCVPFAGSIIGSWLFTRSSEPTTTPRVVYHFTADGKCYWELDHEGERLLATVSYRLTGSALTLCYPGGTERDFPLLVEDDGCVQIGNPNGTFGWMVRLTSPESYLIAFVDARGQLLRLDAE
jgi:hypothetical protein